MADDEVAFPTLTDADMAVMDKLGTRRPMAAVNPVAMTMAHSEGNRRAVAEVPAAAAMTCMRM